LLESADTSFVLLVHGSEDSEVSLLSPSWSPGVLKEPVVGTVIGSISNNEDTVVEGLSAEMLHDSTVVELEEWVSSVDGDGDWSLSDGGGQSRWGLWLDIGEVRDLDGSTSSIASSGSSLVWVLLLGFHHVGLGVGESVVHESSIAAHVSLGLGAVNKLLLRE
jgi:hypothetical protein